MNPENSEEQSEPITLSTLAAAYGTAKLIAHAYHHATRGPTFFSDHEFFGELYAAYDAAFDSLCERVIGLGEADDSVDIIAEACEDFAECKDEGYFSGSMFSRILDLELQFQEVIATLTPNASIGTQNLLAQLADDSEARCYKISQRVAME